MRLLLTALSVLAGWSLLGVLAGGLLMIYKSLESARTSMQRVTMGVRAIEQQSAPLGSYVEALAGSLREAAEATGIAAQRMQQAGKESERA